jgi:hypothetical protein
MNKPHHGRRQEIRAADVAQCADGLSELIRAFSCWGTLVSFARRALPMVWCLIALSLTATDCAAAVKPMSQTSVAVIGEIGWGDADQLAEALDERRRAGHSELTVYLNSLGGNMGEGFAAGMAIAKAAANIVVGENDTCASACFLLFLAGKTKVIFPGAKIGAPSARATTAKLARMYELLLGAPPTVITIVQRASWRNLLAH